MKCATVLVLLAASRPVAVRAAVRLPAPRLRAVGLHNYLDLSDELEENDDGDYYGPPYEVENSEDGGGGGGGAPRLRAAVLGTNDANYFPDPSDEEENSEDGGGGAGRPAVAAR